MLQFEILTQIRVFQCKFKIELTTHRARAAPLSKDQQSLRSPTKSINNWKN